MKRFLDIDEALQALKQSKKPTIKLEIKLLADREIAGVSPRGHFP